MKQILTLIVCVENIFRDLNVQTCYNYNNYLQCFRDTSCMYRFFHASGRLHVHTCTCNPPPLIILCMGLLSSLSLIFPAFLILYSSFFLHCMIGCCRGILDFARFGLGLRHLPSLFSWSMVHDPIWFLEITTKNFNN